MLFKSKFFKTAFLAAVVGLAGAAAVTPASAHDFDHNGGTHRERDSGWGRDHGDRFEHGGQFDRHDRSDRDGRFFHGHRHHHHFRGWF